MREELAEHRQTSFEIRIRASFCGLERKACAVFMCGYVFERASGLDSCGGVYLDGMYSLCKNKKCSWTLFFLHAGADVLNLL